jgi:hypothetical protein
MIEIDASSQECGIDALSRFMEHIPSTGFPVSLFGYTSQVDPRFPWPMYVSLVNEVDAGFESGPISLRVDYVGAVVRNDVLDLIDFLDRREVLQASGRVIGKARPAAPVEFDWTL